METKNEDTAEKDRELRLSQQFELHSGPKLFQTAAAQQNDSITISVDDEQSATQMQELSDESVKQLEELDSSTDLQMETSTSDTSRK